MLLLFVLPMAMASHHVLAQQVTITLNPGWTWVSYPRADTMDLATALASIPPSEGDVIKTQTTTSMFMNGQWYGGLQRLIPGKGLMYKSMKDEDVSFVIGSNSEIPVGAINGLFTINVEGDQVYFSQGNLQYQASTNTWRFAEHQYDRIGAYNANISEYYTGYIDLFGWATSGYNHGAVCYQPWSASTNNDDYWAYGVNDNNLYNETGIADWGYNSINNGGNQTNHWRTLTQNEWAYLILTRTTDSGIRFAHARVNGVGGIILLPDNWNPSVYELINTNGVNANYDSNIITSSDWSILEQYGAVFLPACGLRNGNTLNYDNSGWYWSSSWCLSASGYSRAYSLFFSSGSCNTNNYDLRNYGMSVRLVYAPTSAYLLPAVTTDSITNIADTTAVGCGYVMSDGGLTVTERGICWSTNHTPTLNDSHAVGGTGTGAFTVEMTGLTTNTTYYVRAYAVNSAGMTYGEEVSFTTLDYNP